MPAPEVVEGPQLPTEPLYVVAKNRRLRMGEGFLQAGEFVPGAASWPRLESWVRSGLIVEV